MNRFHFSALAALCLAFTPVSSPAGNLDGLDMTGQVSDKQGAPVPGAYVRILAAGVREGTSPLCAYSYPDCNKFAATDAEGNFRIAALDPSLDFCVRVLAPGYGPYTNSKILPEKEPLKIKLSARELSARPPARHARGRILGLDGNPVAGAILDVEGLVQGDTTHFGGFKADDMGITDANGEYHLAGEQDFDALLVTISAPGTAKRWARLEPGKMQLIRLKEGGTVRGRVVKNGQPLAGMKVDLSTTTRACGEYLTGFHATTDAEGRFTFNHIPAGLDFNLYSLMESLQAEKVSLFQQLKTPADGQALDLGEIPLRPTHHVSGRVVLSDGKPVPPGTRLLLSREEAWDHVLLKLHDDGTFEANGVPEEKFSFYFQIDGYRFSEKNPNLNSGHRALIGRITGDVSSLNILLEPGKPVPYAELEHLSYEEEKSRENQPLRGAPLP